MISVHRSTACREDIAGRLVRSQLIISCECCFNYVYMFYIGRQIKQISPTVSKQLKKTTVKKNHSRPGYMK